MLRKAVLGFAVVVAAVAVPTALGSMSPVVSAHLTGGTETPAGPAGGAGTAVVHLDSKKNQVCWDFTGIKGIGKAAAAHIHKGAAGVAGPVVVPFGAKYSAKGCIAAPGTAIMALEGKPSAYYVNVHTAKYPGGAIRGQLVPGMTGMAAGTETKEG